MSSLTSMIYRKTNYCIYLVGLCGCSGIALKARDDEGPTPLLSLLQQLWGECQGIAWKASCIVTISTISEHNIMLMKEFGRSRARVNCISCAEHGFQPPRAWVSVAQSMEFSRPEPGKQSKHLFQLPKARSSFGSMLFRHSFGPDPLSLSRE